MGTAVYLKRVFFCYACFTSTNQNYSKCRGGSRIFSSEGDFSKRFRKICEPFILLLVDQNDFTTSHKALKRPNCGQTF